MKLKTGARAPDNGQVTTALFGRQLCHALSILQYLKARPLSFRNLARTDVGLGVY